MNMDKTKFARETGSEEVDLGQFIEEEEEEKENDICDDFDAPMSPVRVTSKSHRSTSSKENPTTTTSEIYSSSRSNIMYKTNDKPSNRIVFSREIQLRKNTFIF